MASPKANALARALIGLPDNSEAESYEELGRFVSKFALAEAQVHMLARFLSGTTDDRARVIFEGFRLKDSIDRINALLAMDKPSFFTFNAPKLSASEIKPVQQCLAHLQLIAERRGKLVHRVTRFDNDAFTVSNQTTAKSIASAETQLRVGRQDMSNMRYDCLAIFIKLNDVMQAEDQYFPLGERPSWRYIPPPLHAQKPKRTDGKKVRKGQR